MATVLRAYGDDFGVDAFIPGCLPGLGPIKEWAYAVFSLASRVQLSGTQWYRMKVA